jgi:O-antigen ligase
MLSVAAERRMHRLLQPAWRFAEPLALVLMLPLIWFPFRWADLSAIPLLVLPSAWLVRLRTTGRIGAGTGLEGPLVWVLAFTCVTALPVSDWQLGLPKLLGMAYGAALLVATTNFIRSAADLEVALLAVAVVTLVLCSVGLVGTEWGDTKVPWLRSVYGALPKLIRGVAGSTADAAINPNELAGAVLLVLPVNIVAALRGNPGTLRRSLAGCAALFCCVDLLLAQSRSAFLGAGIGIVVLVALLSATRARAVSAIQRRAMWTVASVAAVGVLLAAILLVAGDRGQFPGEGSQLALTADMRVALYERGLAMLNDFPLTGIGLGQFNPVLHSLYLSDLFPPARFVPHVHNMYLEYLLELGIPGGVAFGLLVIAFFRRCARGAHSDETWMHRVSVGLIAGLVGFGIFGLTDAIAPGARASVILWLLLGLGGSLANISADPVRPHAKRIVATYDYRAPARSR